MNKRLLMISTDRKIFEKDSAVRARQIEYAKNWDEVHIIVFANKKFIEQPLSANCWVYSTRSWTKLFYSLYAIRLGRFICRKRNITEITTQDSSLTANAGIALKKEFNIPLEIQVHEDIGSPYFSYSLKNRIRKAMALSYLPKADSIRVVSKRIKDYLIDVLKSNNTDIIQLESKITVKPIFVDLEKIKGLELLNDADLHKKYPHFSQIILMASRLEKEKNISLALQAFALIYRDHKKVGLIIVGQGSQEKRLKVIVKGLGIESNVIFEKWADQQTLISYYKTADVFLNTSLFEGYGMTLVEAKAAGCKIISTDVGIAREVTDNIVEFDKVDIANKVISYLNE